MFVEHGIVICLYVDAVSKKTPTHAELRESLET